MLCFSDQFAIVTGASSGIGRAIALGLAAQGATLCLVGRDLGRLKAVAESAYKTSPEVLIHQADLILDEDVQELTDRLQRDHKQVDILIHSAASISLGQMNCAPVEDLDRQYRINVHAPYLLTKNLLPMLKSRQGQIVFINSSAGLSAMANAGQYAATKHALRSIADSLRAEVNAEGLRILSVYVGRTATPMQAMVHRMEGRAYHPERLMQPEDVAAVVINALALPRTAEVTDIQIRPLKKLE